MREERLGWVDVLVSLGEILQRKYSQTELESGSHLHKGAVRLE